VRALPAADVIPRDAYVRDVVTAGCSVVLPALRRCPDALYRVRDRHGVDVTVLPASALGPAEAAALARFQFAQYLAVGFIDADVAWRRRMEHLGVPGDPSVHFIASASGTGRLLATATLQALASPPPGARLGDRERPLFPVEEHFGWGVLNRLALLPDTPVDRVREFARLVRNATLTAGATGIRVVTELVLASARVLRGELHTSVDACIGSFERTGVQRNMEFFHTPMVVLRGGLPALPEGHPLNPLFTGCVRRPFALWVHDGGSMTERIDRIGAALERPDSQLIAALAALKRVQSTTRSSLLPREGIPVLVDLDLDQRNASPAARRRARRSGDRLRSFDAFATLSATELTALHTLLGRRRFPAGAVLLRRGERTDTLTWIEHGEAEVRSSEPLALEPGACVGALGVLTAARSPIDVVARTPISALTLPGATYAAIKRGLTGLELAIQRAALAEAAAAWA
jgi:hypothetical protein